MMRIGAIDQGTTSTRLLVVDGDTHEIVASFTHGTQYPRPGCVEQNALEIAGNIERCIAAGGTLKALGLANQGESCLAWDAVTREPLSPIIVWQDSRTKGALAEFDADAIRMVADIAHLPLDAYFSASKLGWLVQEVPAVAAAYRAGRLRLGTTDAFYLDRLAGRFVTDLATASRTSLMDFASGEWSADLCELFGVPIESLPPILPSVGDFGAIGGVPVTASIVDQQAALYGHGCREPGSAKITFGTGAFALALSDGPVHAADAGGLLPTVAWDLGEGPVYALDGGVYDVGSAIEWAIGAGLADSVADFQHFDAPAAIDRNLVFVPAFSGLAAPHWDRSAAPVILGLTAEMTRRDICQALLEGIALTTAEVMASMSAVVPLGPSISIDGGLSRSPYFGQFLADSLDRTITSFTFTERTSLGVAMLAARGMGEEVHLPDSPSLDFTPNHAADHGARRAKFAVATQRARSWRE